MSVVQSQTVLFRTTIGLSSLTSQKAAAEKLPRSSDGGHAHRRHQSPLSTASFRATAHRTGPKAAGGEFATKDAEALSVAPVRFSNSMSTKDGPCPSAGTE